MGAAVPAHSSRAGTTSPSRHGRGRRWRGMPGAVVPARPTPPLRHARKPRACGRGVLSGRRRHSASSAGSPRSGPAVPPARLTMQIFVKTLTGKTITLEVSLHRRAAPPVPAGAPEGGDVPAGSGMRRESPGCAGNRGPALPRAVPTARWGPEWPWQHRACAGSTSWYSALLG